MKKKYITLILAALIAVTSFSIVMKIHPKISRSSEVIDLSYIKLPEYPLPKGYVTKQQVIDNLTKEIKSSLHHGQKIKNIQCVLLPRRIGEKLLYNEPQPSYDELEKESKEGEFIIPSKSEYEADQNKLMYFVIVDVNRAPDEVKMHWLPGYPPKLIDGKWVTTQDTYEIDAATGKGTRHGYYGAVKHIYPRQ